LHNNGVQNVVWLLSPVDLGRRREASPGGSRVSPLADRLNDLIKDCVDATVKVIDYAAFARMAQRRVRRPVPPKRRDTERGRGQSIADWLAPTADLRAATSERRSRPAQLLTHASRPTTS
jgi:hypothetical protein